MHKSDYSVFFSHELTSSFSEFFFGVSHFFNRAKSLTGWQNYDEVLSNHRGGSVLIGQIPVDSFNAELLKELSPAGLIVSCNDCFELAGCGTTSTVTAPSLWSQTGIEHHHLPFTDFTDNANPELLLETLEKMWSIYNSGSTVYVHCKAGRSRSALVVVLFMFRAEFGVSNLQIDPDAVDLETLFREKIENLKEIRPQVILSEAQINLGVRILRRLVNRSEEEVDEQSEIFTQSGYFFSKLTQSPEFKALWHYLYKNPAHFEDMKVFMAALYDNPLEVLAVLNPQAQKTDSVLERACQNIAESDTGAALLDRLRVFIFNNQDRDYQPNPLPLFIAYQQLNQVLEFYKSDRDILAAARELQSAVFLSTAPDEDKERWLKQTVRFLDDPLRWSKHYYAEAENAVLSDSPSTRYIGKLIISIGAAVLISAFFAGIVASSTFTLPVVSMIAVASLAFMFLGKMLMNTAVNESVAEHSRALVQEVELSQGIASFYVPR